MEGPCSQWQPELEGWAEGSLCDTRIQKYVVSVSSRRCPLLASLSQCPKSMPCAWVCGSSFCLNRVD